MLTRRRLRFLWRYLSRNTPWDSGIVPPEIIAWINAAERAHLPPGRALDIGCGTGTTSLYLASCGWDVVGVDFAPNAIGRARRKARRQIVAGSVMFHSADVSRPDFLAGAAPFDLFIDVGCLHGLTGHQRAVYADHLVRLARPGATFLLYAFLPRTDANGARRGIDAAGLESLLAPVFDVVDVALGVEVTAPRRSGWFTLRRTETGS